MSGCSYPAPSTTDVLLTYVTPGEEYAVRLTSESNSKMSAHAWFYQVCIDVKSKQVSLYFCPQPINESSSKVFTVQTNVSKCTKLVVCVYDSKNIDFIYIDYNVAFFLSDKNPFFLHRLMTAHTPPPTYNYVSTPI